MTYVKPFFCLGIASLLLVSACAHGMKPSLTFLSLSLSLSLSLLVLVLDEATRRSVLLQISSNLDTAEQMDQINGEA